MRLAVQLGDLLAQPLGEALSCRKGEVTVLVRLARELGFARCLGGRTSRGLQEQQGKAASLVFRYELTRGVGLQSAMSRKLPRIGGRDLIAGADGKRIDEVLDELA